MKKLVAILCVIFNFITYGKDINEIKSLIAEINEVVNLNGETKRSDYKLTYVFPDFIRKDVLSPELNKGEVYIYNKDHKIVYLPLFDQRVEEKLTGDDNEVLEVINFIFEKEKSDVEFKEKYYAKKIKEIPLKNGARVEIDKLKEFENYLLPTVYKVYDEDINIVNLKVKSYVINPKVDIKELADI
ncbi:hypothetical protein [Fusobacterium sp.]|uniref:hypothetical protein n=1 Tax=Fusobacterium sp. TaxID=68766 RepID=UPI0025BF721F|nr:hypothetical protein [Fusobacterium sp.]